MWPFRKPIYDHLGNRVVIEGSSWPKAAPEEAAAEKSPVDGLLLPIGVLTGVLLGVGISINWRLHVISEQLRHQEVSECRDHGHDRDRHQPPDTPTNTKATGNAAGNDPQPARERVVRPARHELPGRPEAVAKPTKYPHAGIVAGVRP